MNLLHAAIYRVSDGLIVKRVSAPPDMVLINTTQGEEFFLNCPPAATYILNGVPTHQPVVHTLPAATMEVRAVRSCLLADCDWTQMPDVPLSTEQKQAWVAYRQALRDFPENCDIENPVWPTPPS